MTLHVVFRRAAKNELEEAAVWYDEKRTGLGEEFILEIEEAVANAATAPKMALGFVNPEIAEFVFLRVISCTPQGGIEKNPSC